MRGIVASALALALTALPGGCGGRVPAASNAHETPAMRLVVGNTPDLGCIVQGGRADEIVAIYNQTGSSVTVAKWTSSCECLTVSPETTSADKGAPCHVRLVVDFSHEPSFVGDLRIHVQGRDGAGSPVAEFDVLASVVANGQLAALMPAADAAQEAR